MTDTVAVTPEMVREALAHCPHRGGVEQWEWLSERLNYAVQHPDERCPCCGVTFAGDYEY